jgi:hypothetical protein
MLSVRCAFSSAKPVCDATALNNCRSAFEYGSSERFEPRLIIPNILAIETYRQGEPAFPASARRPAPLHSYRAPRIVDRRNKLFDGTINSFQRAHGGDVCPTVAPDRRPRHWRSPARRPVGKGRLAPAETPPAGTCSESAMRFATVSIKRLVSRMPATELLRSVRMRSAL